MPQTGSHLVVLNFDLVGKALYLDNVIAKDETNLRGQEQT